MNTHSLGKLSQFYSPFNCTESSCVVSFEGIDGVGKSTQIQLFSDYLKAKDKTTHILREPGATSWGDKLRNVVLSQESSLHPLAESFLFLSGRVSNITENIEPLALEENTIIILDRFLDSTFAYQAASNELSLESLLQIHATPPLHQVPQLTFWLDLPSEDALQRRNERNEESDYFESKKGQFQKRVSENYQALSQVFPQRIQRIDASQSISVIHHNIIESWEKFHL